MNKEKKTLAQFLCEIGITLSLSEARRAIHLGVVKVNDEKANIFTEIPEGEIKITLGKKEKVCPPEEQK